MYPDRFRLPFLAGVLIAAAERRRPGLGGWSPSAANQLREVFLAELEELRARFLEVFADAAYFDRVQEKLLTVALPRYLAVAEKQTALEQRDYGLWRGGDLLARGALALAGLLLGIVLVKTPWIPIPSTWDLLIFAMALGAPFLPDAQVAWYRRRHRRALGVIVQDLRDAEAQLRLYEPLALADPEPLAPRTDVRTPTRG